MPTWDVSLFYPWQVENSHRHSLELWIPHLASVVYVGYCLFSSCGVHASVGEVLGSLGSGIIRYLDIA